MNAIFSECMTEGGRAAMEGRLDVAEKAFREAYQINRASAEACRSLAAVLHMSNQLDEAVKMWRAALKLEPGSGVCHFNLGLIFMARQDFSAAKESFTKALSAKPHLADAAFNLGRIAYHENDRSVAQKYFERTITIQANHGKAHSTLVQVLTEQGFEAEAIAAGRRGLMAMRGNSGDVPKGYADVLMQTANACRRLDKLEDAAAWYREAVEIDPNNSIAKHLLAAAEGTMSQEHAREYAIKSFDTFARSFDDHLLKTLNYRSPETLMADIAELRPRADALSDVLDLGCGTGLMGEVLARHFQVSHLVGIDLSQNMLDVAVDKNLYQELIHGDLVPTMSARSDEFDLIVSADVFIYVGEVSEVFAQVARLLKPRGLFAFTIEISIEKDVELAPTGRYRHNKSYLHQLSAEYGMRLIREADGLIRKDVREDIVGCYLYFEKQ
jgi:predicted TPR repeat methyltransferase